MKLNLIITKVIKNSFKLSWKKIQIDLTSLGNNVFEFKDHTTSQQYLVI